MIFGDAKFTGVGVESHPWELCKHSWYPYDPGMGNFRSWPCGMLHLCFWPQPLSTSCLVCKTRLAIACFLLTLIFWWILKIILYVYTLHRPLPSPTSLSPLVTLHPPPALRLRCLFVFILWYTGINQGHLYGHGFGAIHWCPVGSQKVYS